MIKYRLSEVAKDLNVSNKEVADVLKARMNVVKKPATVLTEEDVQALRNEKGLVVCGAGIICKKIVLQ